MWDLTRVHVQVWDYVSASTLEKSTDDLRIIALGSKALLPARRWHAAVIFPSSRLLRVTKQVRTGDMVAVPDFSAAHPREKFLCPVRTSAIQRAGFLMIDPLHFKAGVKIVPRARHRHWQSCTAQSMRG